MAAPSVLLGSYEYAGRIIDNYKNAVVLKTYDYLGEPVEYIFTKKPIEDYTIEYTLGHTLSKKRLGNKLYCNSDEYKMLAVHLDLWFGV